MKKLKDSLTDFLGFFLGCAVLAIIIYGVGTGLATCSDTYGSDYPKPLATSESLAKVSTPSAAEEKSAEINKRLAAIPEHREEAISKPQTQERKIPKLASVQSVTPSIDNKSPTLENPAIEEPIETIVYITRTGECYHQGWCSYLRQSKIERTLSSVVGAYRPCSRCNPPR